MRYNFKALSSPGLTIGEFGSKHHRGVIKRIIFLILLLASPAIAEDTSRDAEINALANKWTNQIYGAKVSEGQWVKISSSNTLIFYSAPNAITIQYPNVITVIKIDDISSGDTKLLTYVFRCDDWKINFSDIEPVYLNKKSNIYIPPQIIETEVIKGTINADMFNMFCSMLYKKETK
jgi:hypothetical protein